MVLYANSITVSVPGIYCACVGGISNSTAGSCSTTGTKLIENYYGKEKCYACILQCKKGDTIQLGGGNGGILVHINNITSIDNTKIQVYSNGSSSFSYTCTPDNYYILCHHGSGTGSSYQGNKTASCSWTPESIKSFKKSRWELFTAVEIAFINPTETTSLASYQWGGSFECWYSWIYTIPKSSLSTKSIKRLMIPPDVNK